MIDSQLIASRIKNCRESLGLTQEQLGKKLGLNKSTIQRYETAQVKKIKLPIISAMAEILNTSPQYLSGISNENKPNYEEIDIYKYDNISPIKTKKFRMLGKIACGEPIYANEEYETYIEASANINADFCLTAKGDSMINARIFDGDVVFIKSQPDVENGEIAAVIIGEEVTLKRVYKYTNRIELRPENPLYDVQNYENEKLEEIRILGKAVAFQSYVK